MATRPTMTPDGRAGIRPAAAGPGEARGPGARRAVRHPDHSSPFPDSRQPPPAPHGSRPPTPATQQHTIALTRAVRAATITRRGRRKNPPPPRQTTRSTVTSGAPPTHPHPHTPTHTPPPAGPPTSGGLSARTLRDAPCPETLRGVQRSSSLNCGPGAVVLLPADEVPGRGLATGEVVHVAGWHERFPGARNVPLNPVPHSGFRPVRGVHV